MKKRYKMLVRGEMIYILRWETDGKLFGADWDVSAKFLNTPDNLAMCRQIIKLMNKCDIQNHHRKDERE